jgi:hypothetical protein
VKQIIIARLSIDMDTQTDADRKISKDLLTSIRTKFKVIATFWNVENKATLAISFFSESQNGSLYLDKICDQIEQQGFGRVIAIDIIEEQLDEIFENTELDSDRQ